MMNSVHTQDPALLESLLSEHTDTTSMQSSANLPSPNRWIYLFLGACVFFATGLTVMYFTKEYKLL